MEWFKKLRMVYKILLPVSVTLMLVFAVLNWQIQARGSSIVTAVAERELVALGQSYGSEVQNFINEYLFTSINTADAIVEIQASGEQLSRNQRIGMIKNRINQTVFSCGIAFLPNADGEDAENKNTPGSDANGQFYPEVSASGIGLMNRIYFDSDFFTVPKNTGTPYISEPYMHTTESNEEVVLLTISSPVLIDSAFKGIAYLDISLEFMSEMINDINLYTTGTVTIITQDGVFLTHPNPDLILKNMSELDRWRNNNEVHTAMEAGQPYLGTAWSEGVENVYYFSPFVFPQTGQIMYVALIVPLDELLADVEQLTNATLMISIIALMVLLIVISVSVRSSIKPLGIIVASVEEISRGNLAVSLDNSKFGGELLELHSSLTVMVGSLIDNINKAEAMSKDAQEQTAKAQIATKEADEARLAAEGAKREGMLSAAGQLESVVSIISTASQQLSVQIEQSEHGFNVQASRVAETATAMEEMNSTVLEVASNASAASEMSTRTREKAESGLQIVQSAVTGIQRVQTVSLALKEDMNILATQAESISTIMNVISDIADQTNLLALNAAIEAARAGDAGRGFAVVADEVRKLAEKTMIATTDVGSAIKSIQTSVDTSIRQVDQTVELIGSATEESSQSGLALAEIVSLVDNTAGQVQAIATASEEQSATSEEITRSITEINEIAVNSAQTMRESAHAVNDLAAQTQALGSLIEEMKRA